MNCGLSGSELSNAVTSHSYASVARCRFHTSRNTVPTHQRTSTVPTVSAHSVSLPRLQKHCTYTPANQHCANCIGTLTVTSTPPETPYLHTTQPALCQLYRHTHCHFHASRNTVPIYTPANQHCANCIGTLTVASTPPETPYLHRQPTTRQQHID